MKLIATATLLALFALIQPAAAQAGEADSVNVQETSWQFAKMALTAQRMLQEAHSTREYAFVTSARRHIEYAATNLRKLEGHLASDRYEQAYEILQILRIASESGASPQPQDAVALGFNMNKIDRFVETTFSED